MIDSNSAFRIFTRIGHFTPSIAEAAAPTLAPRLSASLDANANACFEYAKQQASHQYTYFGAWGPLELLFRRRTACPCGHFMDPSRDRRRAVACRARRARTQRRSPGTRGARRSRPAQQRGDSNARQRARDQRRRTPRARRSPSWRQRARRARPPRGRGCVPRLSPKSARRSRNPLRCGRVWIESFLFAAQILPG